MTKRRLDQELVIRKLVTTRSQAESYIKLGKVVVNKKLITKTDAFVGDDDKIKLISKEQYVSRAGLKLASVAKSLNLNFKDKVVLDIGSSTGGFTDYALQHGAKKVIAVDTGTNQLHPSLRKNTRIELHEKLDIRHLTLDDGKIAKDHKFKRLSSIPNIVVMDLSFISLREILPHVATLCGPQTDVIAMVKPQFEASQDQLNNGVVKNDKVRRQILKEFENWVKTIFVIIDKKDSDVAGSKGNLERFYLLVLPVN